MRLSPEPSPSETVDPAVDRDAGPFGVRDALLLAGGSLLVALYVFAAWAPAEGPQEFAYVPFALAPLPWVPMRGFTVEQLYDHVVRITVLGPALIFISLGLRRSVVPALALRLRRVSPVRIAAFLSLGAALAVLAALVFVFRGRAICDDELTYTLQASLLAHGQITSPLLPGFVSEPFSVLSQHGLVGKYLFGEPIVQIPGVLLGWPALMHVPLAAITVWSTYRSTTLLSKDASLGMWTAALIAVSPMFVLCSATAQSEAASLACVAVAGLGYAHVREALRWRDATDSDGPRVVLGVALLGMAVGFGTTVRIQAMVPVGTVLVLAATRDLVKLRAYPALALLYLLLAAWAGSILAYNEYLSGSPLKLPWFLSAAKEQYGFGRVWPHRRYEHTFGAALENLAVVLVRFNGWWLGWPLSVLLLVWLDRYRPTLGSLRIWLWMAIAVIVFELPYYSTGISEVGPIYHFELLVPAAIAGAGVIRAMLAARPRFAASFLCTHFVIGTSLFYAVHTDRLDRLVHYIHDPADAALAVIEKPAILFTEPDCDQHLARGWLHGPFPRRTRLPGDPVVIFTRPAGGAYRAYLERYPGRHCYYYHLAPPDLRPELLRCEDALDHLSRRGIKRDICPMVRSTAEELGWYDAAEAASAFVFHTPEKP